MTEWESVDLGQICTFRAGAAFSPDLQGLRSGDIPFVKVSDLSLDGDDPFIRRSNNWVSSETAISMKAQPIGAHSVIFAKIGEGLKSERIRMTTRPTLLDNNLMAATAKPGLDPMFMRHLFSIVGLASWAAGTALPYLRQGDLARIPVTLPPLDEQRRIATVLGVLDDLIDNNERLAERSERLGQAIAQSALSMVPLGSLGRQALARSVVPTGVVGHYSLPAYDDARTPQVVDGAEIKSSKNAIGRPSVLISRLNPHIPRVWMIYPDSGRTEVASTEFVIFEAGAASVEEIYAVTSTEEYFSQLASLVTGTTGSHQRVDKSALSTVAVRNTLELPESDRNAIRLLVQEASESRIAARQLRRTRDELLPLLMSGRVRVRLDESLELEPESV